MTREEAKELLPVIQAFAEGKTIQYHNPKGEWVDTLGPDDKVLFDDPPARYRIKPEPREPREFWVNIYPDGVVSSYLARSKEEADHVISGNRVDCIRLREVL